MLFENILYCSEIPDEERFLHSTLRVAKTKALISCAVTAQLICVFVFAYAKLLFSHDAVILVIFFNNVCISVKYLTRRGFVRRRKWPEITDGCRLYLGVRNSCHVSVPFYGHFE